MGGEGGSAPSLSAPAVADAPAEFVIKFYWHKTTLARLHIVCDSVEL